MRICREDESGNEEDYKDEKETLDEQRIKHGIDDAINMRLAIFEFNQKINSKTKGKRDNTLDRLTNFEVAKILLFTSTFYSKIFLKRKDDEGLGTIEFYDNYETAEDAIIDSEKIFSKKEGKDGKAPKKREPIFEESDDEIVNRKISEFLEKTKG